MRAETDTVSAPRLILVVEDDPVTRRFYSSVLASGGFSIEEAHNGHQALEKALKSAPNLILTDIAIPGMDGIELCRLLRADVRTRGIPVLAVTGYGDRHYPDRIRIAGADHVLIKPVEPQGLLSEARRLLNQTSPREIG
jgi:CheY-like chemotaxis protein